MTSFLPTIVPSGATRTSTVADGLPSSGRGEDDVRLDARLDPPRIARRRPGRCAPRCRSRPGRHCCPLPSSCGAGWPRGSRPGAPLPSSPARRASFSRPARRRVAASRARLRCAWRPRASSARPCFAASARSLLFLLARLLARGTLALDRDLRVGAHRRRRRRLDDGRRRRGLGLDRRRLRLRRCRARRRRLRQRRPQLGDDALRARSPSSARSRRVPRISKACARSASASPERMPGRLLRRERSRSRAAGVHRSAMEVAMRSTRGSAAALTLDREADALDAGALQRVHHLDDATRSGRCGRPR